LLLVSSRLPLDSRGPAGDREEEAKGALAVLDPQRSPDTVAPSCPLVSRVPGSGRARALHPVHRGTPPSHWGYRAFQEKKELPGQMSCAPIRDPPHRWAPQKRTRSGTLKRTGRKNRKNGELPKTDARIRNVGGGRVPTTAYARNQFPGAKSKMPSRPPKTNPASSPIHVDANQKRVVRRVEKASCQAAKPSGQNRRFGGCRPVLRCGLCAGLSICRART